MIKIEAIHYFAQRGGVMYHRYPDNSISVLEVNAPDCAAAHVNARNMTRDYFRSDKIRPARLVLLEDEFRAVFAGAGSEQGYYVAMHGAGPCRDWL